MAVFRSMCESPLDPALEQDDDLNVDGIGPILPPAILIEDLPISDKSRETVKTARRATKAILRREDDRVVVIVGPCSIHDPKAAKEYAVKLKELASSVAKDLLVIMRVYFEKPRTTVGWKGLINDPDLDGSNHMNKGLRLARELLCYITNLGLPVGCEFLDTITPQFTADLVSWGAIGARTTESQIHRELASGLSMPVGFKNGTDGNLQIAVDAIKSSSCPHTFPGVTKQGLAAVVKTKGNKYCHLILRGANSGPNYEKEYVDQAVQCLEAGKQPQNIMVDVSHGNSQKKHENQPKVLADVGSQIAAGNTNIMGVMIESNLESGKQALEPGKTLPEKLKYGVSVTDACVDWNTTVEMLNSLAKAVRARRETAGAKAVKRPRV